MRSLKNAPKNSNIPIIIACLKERTPPTEVAKELAQSLAPIPQEL